MRNMSNAFLLQILSLSPQEFRTLLVGIYIMDSEMGTEGLGGGRWVWSVTYLHQKFVKIIAHYDFGHITSNRDFLALTTPWSLFYRSTLFMLSHTFV